jgi:hypothetical protein
MPRHADVSRRVYLRRFRDLRELGKASCFVEHVGFLFSQRSEHRQPPVSPISTHPTSSEPPHTHLSPLLSRATLTMSRSTRSSETMRNDQTADLSNEKRAFVSQHLNGTVFPYAIGANRERHSLFSSEVKKERKTLGLHFLKTLLILTVLMWACLSIFW